MVLYIFRLLKCPLWSLRPQTEHEMMNRASSVKHILFSGPQEFSFRHRGTDVCHELFTLTLFSCLIPDCNLSSTFSWQTKWKISGWCLFWQTFVIEPRNSFSCVYMLPVRNCHWFCSSVWQVYSDKYMCEVHVYKNYLNDIEQPEYIKQNLFQNNCLPVNL